MKELAAEYREKLVERVVELDDDAMMAYLDVRELVVVGGRGVEGPWTRSCPEQSTGAVPALSLMAV